MILCLDLSFIQLLGNSFGVPPAGMNGLSKVIPQIQQLCILSSGRVPSAAMNSHENAWENNPPLSLHLRRIT